MYDTQQSEALLVMQNDMQEMHQLGIITDALMSEFDAVCASPLETESCVASSVPAYTASKP